MNKESIRGAEPPPGSPTSPVASSTWRAAESPVYCDPDDDWAKDPSVIKAGDMYFMYYSSANPWQDKGRGGRGEPRIDYATSPDGLKWTYQGLSIPKGKPGEWDEERVQAPAKPILKDGVYYMYYAGKGPKAPVATGYATSTDLRHWTKNPSNPVLHNGKVNDPYIYIENTFLAQPEGTYFSDIKKIPPFEFLSPDKITSNLVNELAKNEGNRKEKMKEIMMAKRIIEAMSGEFVLKKQPLNKNSSIIE